MTENRLFVRHRKAARRDQRVKARQVRFEIFRVSRLLERIPQTEGFSGFFVHAVVDCDLEKDKASAQTGVVMVRVRLDGAVDGIIALLPTAAYAFRLLGATLLLSQNELRPVQLVIDVRIGGNCDRNYGGHDEGKDGNGIHFRFNAGKWGQVIYY